ncbi:MAG: Recombinase [Candidatus Woesebacteria bacterium GW2011_GWA2_40_7b]|uniref:Recombinase n=1 Tax=Candidatus Woesebacteria bacterium GW2011_GWA2_40_7b TaxID=1618563 RepID=A0A0G0VEB1_9BACT|nr:MAG: Recombinase [Candidatus Woesebacteria bacterium GW2011_GWA2_40_7b]KKS88032.1 MAG: Recombinase [Parcubacteria group bacterium GW2011_GWC1_43_11]
MKYIGYCRKSTDEKDKQVLSIDQQISSLKEFAKKDKLEIAEFVTEAKTAKDPGREKFAEVLKKIEAGEAEGIVSWHPDRLARNSIDGGKIIYLLDTGKLKDLKFPTFWFENTPQGKFMLNIAFGQSKYYVDNLSENIKRALHYKLKKGIWPTKAPPGYSNNLKTREIDIDPIKSKIIKKAFEMFADGNVSFVEIARFLKKFGMCGRTGKLMKIDQLKKVILTNPFYIGIMKYGGEINQGKHKLFISKDLFNKVQKQITKIERPRYKGNHFAFSGLARCGECGAAITAEKHTKLYKNGNSQTFIYYRCTKKLIPCSQKYISEQELEEQMRKNVLKLALPDSWQNDWENWLEKDKISEQKKSEANIKNLELEIKNLEIKLNLLLDGYLDGTIEAETYKAKKNELFEKKLALEDKIVRIKEKGSSWLEPFESFINQAFQAEKIVSDKNNPEELCSFGKSAGSNFNLQNRQISFTPNLGWDSVFFLCARFRSRTPSVLTSLSVPRAGLEPAWVMHPRALKALAYTISPPRLILSILLLKFTFLLRRKGSVASLLLTFD